MVNVSKVCNVEVTLINRKGLHARAAAKFVKTVAQFNAEVWVTKNGQRVGGASIMGLMMLAAGCGACLSIESRGPQAEHVSQALLCLINEKFREE